MWSVMWLGVSWLSSWSITSVRYTLSTRQIFCSRYHKGKHLFFHIVLSFINTEVHDNECIFQVKVSRTFVFGLVYITFFSLRCGYFLHFTPVLFVLNPTRSVWKLFFPFCQLIHSRLPGSPQADLFSRTFVLGLKLMFILYIPDFLDRGQAATTTSTPRGTSLRMIPLLILNPLIPSTYTYMYTGIALSTSMGKDYHKCFQVESDVTTNIPDFTRS